MRLVIVGTGYVGLVTGAGLSSVGLDVTCVDIDEDKVAALKDGQVPIYEPGLEELIQNGVKHNRLRFTTELGPAVKGADAVFLCVGTPMSDDGGADLSYLFSAAEQVAKAADGPLAVITKSTVPVGTASQVKAILDEHGAGKSLTVASNPEFLKEGNAVKDFLSPDRIVVGTDDDKTRALLEKLYRPFLLREFRVLHMDVRSAELTKYAANGMLALRISFMNEVANLCEKVGADIEQVRRGISKDQRIGSAFLYAGVGYGGSCFPKDVRALSHTGRAHGLKLSIMDAVDEVNLYQRGVMLEKVLNHFDGDVKGKTIAVWGIAFKPRTDDIREAPAIPLIEGLLAAGAKVRAYDRAALKNAKARFKDKVVLVEDEYAALDDAEALVLMTEWPEFRLPSWDEVKRRMHTCVVFDGRNIYRDEVMTEEGIPYYGIGRGKGVTC
ncbi:MAG: UDP-glucose/GDP-mannose dehydrogenase family protein [Deltaproteobacteria bacterium]|nr:UDP-glucose/GDP-mannose dehydrogenase family protein [Deltaproteobacteria bacterium]